MVIKTSPLASSYTTSKRNTSSHYDGTKPNEQRHLDLLYIPHNLFEGNTYKYILTSADVAYKVARPLSTKKSSEVAFVLEAIYIGDVLKYPKTFQIDNASEFKNEVTKLLKKNNVDIRRATTKYKHTHMAFLEAFNKELAKLLFKPIEAKSFKTRKSINDLDQKFEYDCEQNE